MLFRILEKASSTMYSKMFQEKKLCELNHRCFIFKILFTPAENTAIFAYLPSCLVPTVALFLLGKIKDSN